jgi:hypothetical protein
MPVVNPTLTRRLLARAGTLLFIGVLLCVPGLTRVGQHVSASQGPTLSFAKSTDFPPKKITIEHVRLIVSLTELACAATPPVATFVRASDTAPPTAFTGSAPRPLRAPPSARLS